MTFKLYEEVVLTKDIPNNALKKGDVATIIEQHLVSDGEVGYSLELFDALGENDLGGNL